jgi:phage terminase large subunit
VYGGVWNNDASEYVSFFDANLNEWVGPEPKEIKTSYVSAQALSALTNFHDSYILSLGGRRSGKTYVEAQKAAILVLMFPGTRGMVVSPTYRQVRNVWNHIYSIVPRHWLLPGQDALKKSDNEMHFTNGAVIVFRSADNPDSCRSDGVAWCLMDERQSITDEAAGNAIISCSESNDDYIIMETATINAEFRDHHDKIEAKKDASVYRMVSTGNPFIGHKIFEDAKGILDARTYAQEIDAEWPEVQGRVYYPFDKTMIRDYPIPDLRDITVELMADKFGTPLDGRMACEYYISIDPPHSAVIWKIYEGMHMHAIDEIVVNDIKDGDVKDLALQCKARYYPAIVANDPHDTAYDFDTKKYFAAAGYRIVQKRKLPIEHRVTSVRAKMEHDEFSVDPRCKYLIDSCYKQKYDPKTGKPEKQQFYTKAELNPQLTMDHIADAMGYGIYKLCPIAISYAKLEELAA